MPNKTPQEKLDYLKQWKKANPDKVEAYRLKDLANSNARKRKWYYKNHEETKKVVNAYHKEWTKKNPARRKAIVRKAALKRYGLIEQQYTELLIKQNNCCATCPEKKNPNKNNLHIDHCHKTNKVCGLLCGPCNTALGLLKENEELMFNLINYLRKSNT